MSIEETLPRTALYSLLPVNFASKKWVPLHSSPSHTGNSVAFRLVSPTAEARVGAAAAETMAVQGKEEA